jgi:hypothetical protein
LLSSFYSSKFELCNGLELRPRKKMDCLFEEEENFADGSFGTKGFALMLK